MSMNIKEVWKDVESILRSLPLEAAWPTLAQLKELPDEQSLQKYAEIGTEIPLTRKKRTGDIVLNLPKGIKKNLPDYLNNIRSEIGNNLIEEFGEYLNSRMFWINDDEWDFGRITNISGRNSGVRVTLSVESPLLIETLDPDLKYLECKKETKSKVAEILVAKESTIWTWNLYPTQEIYDAIISRRILPVGDLAFSRRDLKSIDRRFR